MSKRSFNTANLLGELGRNDDALETLNRIPFQDFNPEVLEASFLVHLKMRKT